MTAQKLTALLEYVDLLCFQCCTLDHIITKVIICTAIVHPIILLYSPILSTHLLFPKLFQHNVYNVREQQTLLDTNTY